MRLRGKGSAPLSSSLGLIFSTTGAATSRSEHEQLAGDAVLLHQFPEVLGAGLAPLVEFLKEDEDDVVLVLLLHVGDVFVLRIAGKRRRPEVLNVEPDLFFLPDESFGVAGGWTLVFHDLL